MPQPLLIIGASVRAAAFSALRAGYAPIAGDAFADVDLRDRCRAALIDDYPRGLARFARQFPAIPWLYTGALENEPMLVDLVSRDRVLWGNSADVLRQVRDPWRLATAVEQAGLPTPRLAANVEEVLPGVTWLSKPLASCGGGQIYPLDADARTVANRRSAGKRYYQQFIAGEPCAAVFVAARGRVQLLGVTQQLTGVQWAGAERFRYAGSIGPLRLTDECELQLRRLGQTLAASFQLTGLFGVDAILAGDAVWPVEVNPRYTASIEILERALGFHAIELHAAACVEATLPERLPLADDKTASCGKAIVYAPADVVIRNAFTQRLLAACDGPWPRFADIPAPGTKSKAGQPVVSVFAEGSSAEGVATELRRLAGDVRRWLSESQAPCADPEGGTSDA